MNVDDLTAVLSTWREELAAAGDHRVEHLDAPTQRRVVMAGLRANNWDLKRLKAALRTKPELLELVPEMSRVLNDASRTGTVEGRGRSADLPAGNRTEDAEPSSGRRSGGPAPVPASADGSAPPAGESGDDVAPATRSSPASSGMDKTWQLPRYAFEGGGPEPHKVVVAATDAGLVYSWEPSTREGGTLYRVVTSEIELPYSPDEFAEVAVTEAVSVLDPEPATSAIRYVTVWAYPRPASGTVVVGQPLLLAATEHVHQLQMERLAPDGTTIVGRWRRPTGAARVILARLSAHEAGRALATGSWHEHRILGHRDNLAGFTDADVVPGESYRYVGVVEVESGGQVYQSAPTVRQVTMPPRLEPVRDLRVTENHENGRSTFSLRWTDPGGDAVEVYRTRGHPTSGLEDEVNLTHAMLAAMGLSPTDEIPNPVEKGRAPDGTDDGTRLVNDVAWPEGPDWERAYFTPVTVIDGDRVRVGRTVVATRTRTIEQIRVLQRATRQVITFAWPGEAAEVALYVTAAGAGVPENATPTARIDRDRYRDVGGFVLDRALPSRGCTLHLLPVSYYGGESVAGAVTSVRHDWYVTLRYELRRKALGRRCEITVHVQEELVRPPAFVLVHNPERLPLHRGDGDAVAVVPDGAPEGAEGSPVIRPRRLGNSEGDPLGTANLGRRERHGYLRLFVDVNHDELLHWALLDPPLKNLIAGQPGGQSVDRVGVLGRRSSRG